MGRGRHTTVRAERERPGDLSKCRVWHSDYYSNMHMCVLCALVLYVSDTYQVLYIQVLYIQYNIGFISITHETYIFFVSKINKLYKSGDTCVHET